MQGPESLTWGMTYSTNRNPVYSQMETLYLWLCSAITKQVHESNSYWMTSNWEWRKMGDMEQSGGVSGARAQLVPIGGGPMMWARATLKWRRVIPVVRGGPAGCPGREPGGVLHLGLIKLGSNKLWQLLWKARDEDSVAAVCQAESFMPSYSGWHLCWSSRGPCRKSHLYDGCKLTGLWVSHLAC